MGELLTPIRAFAQKFIEACASTQTQQVYKIGLCQFLDWYEKHGNGELITAMTLKRFRASVLARGRSTATANLYTTIARCFVQAAVDEGVLPMESAVSVRRVRVLPASPTRPGRWLDLATAEKLLAAPDPATIVGIRDRAILGLLLGAGLRRAELARLRYEHFRHFDGCWWIWRMAGKGRRVRDIPIADWSKQLVDDWAAAAGLPNSGPVFCRIDRGDHPATAVPLRTVAAYAIVRRYAKAIGLKLSPHDLRRTFAQLAETGGSPLRQIQLSLGHASVATTERYLLREQTVADAPANLLGIRLGPHRETIVAMRKAVI